MRACAASAAGIVARDDDTAEVLTARIHDHHEDIGPVLELLRRKAPVFVVDASRDPDTVQREIRALLGLPPSPAARPKRTAERSFGVHRAGDQLGKGFPWSLRG